MNRLDKVALSTQIIACDAVNADAIDVTLEDVGGLENAKTALMQKIILPLRKPELFNVSLLRQAKGVLLYGPPGTGKTMLAKVCTFSSDGTSKFQHTQHLLPPSEGPSFCC